MKISYIAIGAIASVLTINSVMAAGENTVASKSYVDARDDLKQDLIPRSGANSSTPGSTVVTYTDAEGEIGERGIYDGENDYDEDYDADSLVTAGVIADFAETMESLTINDQELTMVNHNLQPCNAGDSGCDLWTIGSNTQSVAAAGTFAPLTSAAPACLAYGATFNTSATECCSGVERGGKGDYHNCGCSTVTDCPSVSGKIASCNTNSKTCSYINEF